MVCCTLQYSGVSKGAETGHQQLNMCNGLRKTFENVISSAELHTFSGSHDYLQDIFVSFPGPSILVHQFPEFPGFQGHVGTLKEALQLHHKYTRLKSHYLIGILTSSS